MARIRLLVDIQTDKYLLKAGREVMCNWRDATTMQIAGLAVILWPAVED